MPEPSLSKPRHRRPAVSEVYSAALLVAITLALSMAAYSVAGFHASPDPVYTASSYSVYGTPSFLHIQVNSSAPTSASEFRIDGVSSLSGFLALTAGGYASAGSFCAAGETTFFSVSAGSGTLAVSGSGTVWIDGVEGPTAAVRQGWHEIVIADGSGCSIELPGGAQVVGPSPSVSTLPMGSLSPRSFTIMIPYYAGGHSATVVFDGGTQAFDF